MENIEKCNNKWVKRLFCKHQYKYKEQMLINTGMKKMIVYNYGKMRKEKV